MMGTYSSTLQLSICCLKTLLQSRDVGVRAFTLRFAGRRNIVLTVLTPGNDYPDHRLSKRRLKTSVRAQGVESLVDVQVCGTPNILSVGNRSLDRQHLICRVATSAASRIGDLRVFE